PYNGATSDGGEARSARAHEAIARSRYRAKARRGGRRKRKASPRTVHPPSRPEASRPRPRQTQRHPLHSIVMARALLVLGVLACLVFGWHLYGVADVRRQAEEIRAK